MNYHYLIDFENVHKDGLAGLEEIEEGSFLHIFYSENARNITLSSFGNAKMLHMEVIKVPVGKQSLDMQLVSFLGYLIGKEDSKDNKYIIVSKDNGYGNTPLFWDSLGVGDRIEVRHQVGLEAPKEPQPELFPIKRPEGRKLRAARPDHRNSNRRTQNGPANNEPQQKPSSADAVQNTAAEKPAAANPQQNAAEALTEKAAPVVKQLIKLPAQQNTQLALPPKNTQPVNIPPVSTPPVKAYELIKVPAKEEQKPEPEESRPGTKTSAAEAAQESGKSVPVKAEEPAEAKPAELLPWQKVEPVKETITQEEKPVITAENAEAISAEAQVKPDTDSVKPEAENTDKADDAVQKVESTEAAAEAKPDKDAEVRREKPAGKNENRSAKSGRNRRGRSQNASQKDAKQESKASDNSETGTPADEGKPSQVNAAEETAPKAEEAKTAAKEPASQSENEAVKAQEEPTETKPEAAADEGKPSHPARQQKKKAEPKKPQQVSEKTILNNQLMQTLAKNGVDAATSGMVTSLILKNIGEKNHKQLIYREIVKAHGQKNGLKYYGFIKPML